MFDDDFTPDPVAVQVHDQRTADLTEDEKKIYNDGYLWASADAVTVVAEVLSDEDLSASEKLEALDAVITQATVPLMIASMATGKQYI